MVLPVQQPADILDEAPDAFLPDLLRGQLVEAEHLVRYWWIAQAVQDLRVLDAGCGLAHGSQMLAEAGAEQVTGIDSAAALLEASSVAHPALRLQRADVCELPFADASFGVVVAFGLLDQVPEPLDALSELMRVLSPEGTIAISLPHVTPGDEPNFSEIGESLAESCGEHVVLRQRNWTTSAILEEEISKSTDRGLLEEVDIRKVVSAPPKSELTRLIIGSRGTLKEMRGSAVITHPFAQQRWLQRCLELEQKLAEQERDLLDLERERDVLARRLLELDERQ